MTLTNQEREVIDRMQKGLVLIQSYKGDEALSVTGGITKVSQPLKKGTIGRLVRFNLVAPHRLNKRKFYLTDEGRKFF